ncbi:MAG: hypothetical protein V4520_16060 [Bacteroidota bacterium]
MLNILITTTTIYLFKYRPEDFKQDNDDLTDAEDLDAKLDVRSLLERFKQEAH